MEAIRAVHQHNLLKVYGPVVVLIVGCCLGLNFCVYVAYTVVARNICRVSYH